MIHQNESLLAGWIQHYACLADVIAAFREFVMGMPWRLHEFGASLHLAVDKGIISGDVNGDGDMDDPSEALILDFQKYVDHLGLPLRYLGKFDQNDFERFSGPNYWVAVAWRNPRTGFVHWVLGNRRPVQWDSIKGGSVTVAEGAPWPLQKDGSGGIRVFEVTR